MIARRTPHVRVTRGRVVRREPPVRVAAASSAELLTVDRRNFLDASGALWSVREVDCRLVPGALAARCLVFDSAAIVRRVWHYPRDWAELDDVALRRLLESPR